MRPGGSGKSSNSESLTSRFQNERLLLGPAYDDNGLVVCQPNGKLWLPDNFTAAYRRFVRSTEFGAPGFHALRHTHATQLLSQHIHPKIVSERLGHASVAITLDAYSHVIEGMQGDAAAKIDEALRVALERPA
jgi:integrase